MENTDTFLSVIRNHKGIIYKIARSFCLSEEDRKDPVQEIIIQLWKAFDSYNSDFKHSTWIYRIALNVAISFNRKEKSRKRLSYPLAEDIIHLKDMEYSEEKENDLGILHQAISQLKDLEKALILLYLEEKSHKEIALIMGISETNVSTKIGRTKIALKQIFNQIKNQ